MAGIVGFSGLPRHGKSYGALELYVLPSLQEGRKIVTNLPLKMDVVLQDFPNAQVELIPDLFAHDWENVGNGVLLVLDEVWRLWQQGQKMTDIPPAQLSLLKEHGHRSDENGRSMDIVLITQDMNDLCKTVRDLIETSFITVKHLDLGQENRFIRYTCRKAATLGKDNAPPKNQTISSANGVYEEKVYRYYKTHMHSQGNAAPNEARIVKSTFFNSWKFKAGLTVVALSLVGMVWGSMATKDKMSKMTAKKTPAADTSKPVPVASAQVSTVPVTPPMPLKPAYSDEWRIAGKIFGKTGESTKQLPMVILVSKSGVTRLISAYKCKREDYEDFCDIDGEVITRFTGQHNGGYLNETPLDGQKIAAN